MLAYFDQFVNILNRPKTYLLLVNVLLVFFLILLSNAEILPISKIQDFIFFAIIFLIFALYRPGWGFLFFIGTIVLENINLAPEILTLSIRPYQFIGGITLLAVVIRFLAKRINFDLPKFKLFDWGVLVFVLGGFLSALGALDRGISLKQSVVALSFAILYFLTRIFIQNIADLKRITPFFLSSGVIVLFYGIWQNIRFTKGLNAFEAMPGRPNSTFVEADWMGIYLVLLITVLYAAIYYFNEGPHKQESLISNDKFPILNPCLPAGRNFPVSKFFKLFSLYIILSTSYILLVLTVSRSAWLGITAVTIVYLLVALTQLKWKKTLTIKMVILTSLVIAIGAVHLFNLTAFQLRNRVGSTATGLQKITISCANDIKLPEKINSVDELQDYDCRHINLENIATEKQAGNFVKEIDRPDPNVNVRAQIYQKSWETIKANPILGIGWGNSSLILGHDGRGTPLNSSNIFLETWLGSGILGLLALAFIWYYTIYRGIRAFLTTEGGNKAFGLFIILGSIAILIPNLFNAGIFLGFLWVFWGITMANGIE